MPAVAARRNAGSAATASAVSRSPVGGWRAIRVVASIPFPRRVLPAVGPSARRERAAGVPARGVPSRLTGLFDCLLKALSALHDQAGIGSASERRPIVGAVVDYDAFSAAALALRLR